MLKMQSTQWLGINNAHIDPLNKNTLSHPTLWGRKYVILGQNILLSLYNTDQSKKNNNKIK